MLILISFFKGKSARLQVMKPKKIKTQTYGHFLATEEEKTSVTLTTAQTLINQYMSSPLEKRLSIQLDFSIKSVTLGSIISNHYETFCKSNELRFPQKGYFQR